MTGLIGSETSSPLEAILDASAILALLLKEDGHERVTDALIAGAGVCTVNLAEVAARCARVGMPPDDLRQFTRLMPVTWIKPDLDLAYRAGEMVAITGQFGLSLGDRFCLALAEREKIPAFTADREWLKAGPLLGVEVSLIRSRQ